MNENWEGRKKAANLIRDIHKKKDIDEPARHICFSVFIYYRRRITNEFLFRIFSPPKKKEKKNREKYAHQRQAHVLSHSLTTFALFNGCTKLVILIIIIHSQEITKRQRERERKNQTPLIDFNFFCLLFSQTRLLNLFFLDVNFKLYY